ncbi:MAG TPA: response regulator [bacterium]|nr:response regulator [bacterium]
MTEKVKILLVEDEAITAMMLESELQDMGYQVYNPIATGEAAVKAGKKYRFDVVLMDIRLAGKMNGIEAAKKILSYYQVPIIFMTGYSEHHIKVQAQALGAAAYLVKPIDSTEIKLIIDGLFGEK